MSRFSLERAKLSTLCLTPPSISLTININFSRGQFAFLWTVIIWINQRNHFGLFWYFDSWMWTADEVDNLWLIWRRFLHFSLYILSLSGGDSVHVLMRTAMYIFWALVRVRTEYHEMGRSRVITSLFSTLSIPEFKD